RRRHTRSKRDWSSDVCSSDLITTEAYLAKRFLAFSEECKGRCRLYEVVSTAISEDRELLDLASYAPKSQPIPNLLFASVHYLILTGIQHELRNFYRSVVIIPT